MFGFIIASENKEYTFELFRVTLDIKNETNKFGSNTLMSASAMGCV